MPEKNIKGVNLPDDEYEPEIVDLDGEPFEVIDGIDVDGTNYLALVPYTEDDTMEGEAEFVILKEVEENGEYFLATIDDDKLYDELGEKFVKHFSEMFDELDAVE